jgi:hypothetical protein
MDQVVEVSDVRLAIYAGSIIYNAGYGKHVRESLSAERSSDIICRVLLPSHYFVHLYAVAPASYTCSGSAAPIYVLHAHYQHRVFRTRGYSNGTAISAL